MDMSVSKIDNLTGRHLQTKLEASGLYMCFVTFALGFDSENQMYVYVSTKKQW